MLPSISIDDDVLRHCSLVAFAEVLDYFKGIEHFSGTAVGLRLQKFWIISVESNVLMAWEQRFGRLDSTKLALEQRCGCPDDAKLLLEQRL